MTAAYVERIAPQRQHGARHDQRLSVMLPMNAVTTTTVAVSPAAAAASGGDSGSGLLQAVDGSLRPTAQRRCYYGRLTAVVMTTSLIETCAVVYCLYDEFRLLPREPRWCSDSKLRLWYCDNI